MDVRRIWDQSPYSAFPDLIRYQDRWLCVFREGIAHAGDCGTLRLIVSDDGDNWHSLSQLFSESCDLRDGKLSITPQGQLMLNTGELCDSAAGRNLRSLSYFSDDGVQWQGPFEIGDPNFWLWRTEWHNQVAYSIGYGKERFVRLYRSEDGKQFTTLIDSLYDENGPNESALLFRDDGSCLCLLRRDNIKGKGGDNGLLGIATPPYTKWQWRDIGCRIGGPEMVALPDGSVVAAVRKYHFNSEGKYESEWLELCWVDDKNGAFETIMTLPSGGDCGYAGMVWHEGLLWVSYYSSHEERPSIYLARVGLT